MTKNEQFLLYFKEELEYYSFFFFFFLVLVWVVFQGFSFEVILMLNNINLNHTQIVEKLHFCWSNLFKS